MFAGCAEIRKFRKIGCFVHFGETGDSPVPLIFYFQYNHWKKSTFVEENQHGFDVMLHSNAKKYCFNLFIQNRLQLLFPKMK